MAKDVFILRLKQYVKACTSAWIYCALLLENGQKLADIVIDPCGFIFKEKSIVPQIIIKTF